MPWNEISRRYVSDEPEFYIPDVFRAAAENVKQGSSDDDSGYDRHAAIEHSQNCLDEYNARLAHGVCAEQARDALPLNTMTEWYWSGTLGAYADMLTLRLANGTQKESRIVAQKAQEVITPLFPVSLKALLENV
jgi:thymidylate synthase (FAD)